MGIQGVFDIPIIEKFSKKVSMKRYTIKQFPLHYLLVNSVYDAGFSYECTTFRFYLIIM